MYLGLPLPMTNLRLVHVTLFKNDASTPVKYSVCVPTYGKILILKKELAKLAGIHSSCIEVCDVFNSRFFKIFQDQDSISLISKQDLIQAYELYLPADEEETYIHLQGF